MEGGGNAVLPLENAGTERNGGTQAIDDAGRWDAVVAAWFDANPQALKGPAKGISDLARAMCRDNEGGSDANYEAYKGRAHALFHEYRNRPPAARLNPNRIDLSTDEGRAAWAQYMADAQLPSGDKLGTDTSCNAG